MTVFSTTKRGVTLVELLIASAFATVIMLSVYSAMVGFQDVYYAERSMIETQEVARRALAAIRGELLESSGEIEYNSEGDFDSMKYVFSDFNLEHGGGSPVFPKPNTYEVRYGPAANFSLVSGLRQCARDACRWRQSFPNSQLGRRTWYSSEVRCPVCLAGNVTLVNTDALAFYSPRDNPDLGWDYFHRNANGTPQWRAVIFYYPFLNAQINRMELRRSVFYLSDINNTPGFGFGDLLTFDADYEKHMRFQAAPENDGSGLYWMRLWFDRSTQDGTRYLRFMVIRENATAHNMEIVVRHPTVTGGAERTIRFFRRPTVVVNNLVDCDFSTHYSNPLNFDSTDDTEDGDVDPGLMRITLALEKPTFARGETGWGRGQKLRYIQTVVQTTVKPRN